ncbi:MAG: ester cyclase [Trueperaceae bacterium]|nr:ester cyclase [Trueperaceae bacterium]
MATEDDRAAAIAIFESGWNRGEFGGLDGHLRRAVRLSRPRPHTCHGPRRARAIVAGWRRGFPDLHFDLRDVVAEGGRVAIRATLTGTHRGEWNGRPPTANAIAVDHFFLLRFDQGLLVEVFEVLDSAALERQLEPGPSGG